MNQVTKNVTSERATFRKAEREYVKGMIRNLSFQRLTDREIVQWLHDEKQIDLDRSTISKTRIE
jgi:methionine synthase II (cobalamin-independent)